MEALLQGVRPGLGCLGLSMIVSLRKLACGVGTRGCCRELWPVRHFSGILELSCRAPGFGKGPGKEGCEFSIFVHLILIKMRARARD